MELKENKYSKTRNIGYNLNGDEIFSSVKINRGNSLASSTYCIYIMYWNINLLFNCFNVLVFIFCIIQIK